MGSFDQMKKGGARGNGPPPVSEVSRSELFRRISDKSPPFEILPFPRKDDDGEPIGHYRLQVLRQRDIDQAAAEAERYVRKAMQDGSDRPNQEAWREVYDSALMVELTFRACRDKEDASQPLFPSPQDIRSELTQSEIVHLTNSYQQLQHRFGPSFAILTEEETDEWLDALYHGGELDLGPLGCLSPGQLVQLIAGLASRLRKSPTDTSFAGRQSSSSGGDTATTSLPSNWESEGKE